MKDAQIRSAKPTKSRYRLRDGAGLYLEVQPSGAKIFRLEYRVGEERRTETVGNYPNTTLGAARGRRTAVQEQIRAGLDPRPKAQVKSAEKSHGPTWREMCEEYLVKLRQEGWTNGTIKKIERNVRKTFPKLGARPIDQIEGPELLEVLRPIEAAGKFETAQDVRRRMSQVFQYSVALGACKFDPAHAIRAALVKHKPGKRPGLTQAEDVGALMRAIRGYKCEPQTRAGLLLSAYCAVRSLELRGAKWSEVDFEARMWTVPKERMKKKYGRHLVPLSTQAVTCGGLTSRAPGKLLPGFSAMSTTLKGGPAVRKNWRPTSPKSLRKAPLSNANTTKTSPSSSTSPSARW